MVEKINLDVLRCIPASVFWENWWAFSTRKELRNKTSKKEVLKTTEKPTIKGYGN